MDRTEMHDRRARPWVELLADGLTRGAIARATAHCGVAWAGGFKPSAALSTVERRAQAAAPAAQPLSPSQR